MFIINAAFSILDYDLFFINPYFPRFLLFSQKTQ